MEFWGVRKEGLDRKINYAKATGNFTAGVGKGACIPFGHGGPGEFGQKLLEAGENHKISIYETGVKKEVVYKPHFYRHFDFPIQEPKDLKSLVLPDPKIPPAMRELPRKRLITNSMTWWYSAMSTGFFSGIHYYLYPFERLLESLFLEPDFVHAMLARLGDFNLKAAENLLKCGSI